jgi:hypothetical protein
LRAAAAAARRAQPRPQLQPRGFLSAAAAAAAVAAAARCAAATGAAGGSAVAQRLAGCVWASQVRGGRVVIVHKTECARLAPLPHVHTSTPGATVVRQLPGSFFLESERTHLEVLVQEVREHGTVDGLRERMRSLHALDQDFGGVGGGQ